MLILKQLSKLIIQQIQIEQKIQDFTSFLKKQKKLFFEFSQGTVKGL